MRRYVKWREFLVPRLRRGEITVTTAAWIAGVAKSSVVHWCRQAGIRPKEAEHARALRLRQQAERWMRGDAAPLGAARSKAQLRREADTAKHDWDLAHGRDS